MSKRELVNCERCGVAYFKDKKGGASNGSSKNLCPKCGKLVKKIKLDVFDQTSDL